MNNEQHDQQPQIPPTPSAPPQNPRREFAKKAGLTAIGAAVSAITRAAWNDLFGS
ncbi:hypothetical protein ACWDZ8_22040 [Streptomyces sp. NPDC003233]